LSNGQWSVTTGAKTDTLQGIEKVVIGGQTYDLVDHLGADVGGFQTIQAAVDAAGSGDIIEIAGDTTYDEQVVVDGAASNLTLQGLTGAVLQAPTTPLVNTAADPAFPGAEIDGVLTIVNAAGIVVQGLTVDGAVEGANLASGGDEVGIASVNSTGTVIGGVGAANAVTVENVRQSDGYFGDQTGFAIYAANATANEGNSVTIQNTTVQNFQKDGILIENADATVVGDTIIGTVNNVIAQNGIEIGGTSTTFGAGFADGSSSGTVSGNVVQNIGLIHDYGIEGDSGSGILAYNDSNLSITGNTVALANASTTGQILIVPGQSVSAGGAFNDGIDALNFGTAESNVSITDNNVTGAGSTLDAGDPGHGIDYQDGVGGAVSGNSVSGVDVGVEIDPDTNGASGAALPGTATPTVGVNTAGGDIGSEFFQGDGSNTPTPMSVATTWTFAGSGPGAIYVTGTNAPDAVYSSIQAAVDAASAGDVIHIGAGVYAENVTITTDDLTLVGQGDSTVIEGTFKSDNNISNGGVAAFLETNASYTQKAGSGIVVSATNDLVENLKIDGFDYGVFLSDGANATGLTGVDVTDSLVGLHKGTTAGVDGLTINGGSFSDGLIGIDLDKTTSIGAQDVGNATDVLIDGTSFDDLVQKGIYAETLSDSTINGVTMYNVGQFGAPSTSGALGSGGDGIDLNLKNGAYSDDVIENFTLTNTGASTGSGSVVGNANGGAIVIEARDQGSYAGAPAVYTGAVTVENGTINGTSTGIQAGEPNQSNAGPAVNISNVTISNAEIDASHGDVANVTKSTMTIVLPSGGGRLCREPDHDGKSEHHRVGLRRLDYRRRRQ
jgi:hypothetical protein